MENFYNEKELALLGLKKVGNNVLISRNANIYGAENISIGNNVRIDDFCILSGVINIGNYIHIAAYSAIYGGKAGVYVGDFSNISSRVTIYAICDDFSGASMTNPMVPEKYKKIRNDRVIIGKHTIIGATSVVLPGIETGEGSAFGSFSFINRSSEPWSMNAGIPYKKIGDRKKDIVTLEQKLLKEKDLTKTSMEINNGK